MAILADKVRILRTPWAQGLGLMFRWPKGRFAYVFPLKSPRRLAITMWYVFYAIDLVFLDANNKIVELQAGVRPFTHYWPKHKALVLIEFPKGTIAKYRLKPGQSLVWSKNSVESRS